MKKIINFLKRVLVTIVFFGMAMAVVVLVSAILVYFFEWRWTIAFNITAFTFSILILADVLVSKLVSGGTTSNSNTKQPLIQKLAKAIYSLFV